MVAEYTVKVKGLAKLQKKLAAYPQIVGKVMHSAMLDSTKKLKENIKIEMHRPTRRGVRGRLGMPIHQGRLLGSIADEVQGIGGRIVGSVGTDVEYGPAVEYGRPPGSWPDIEAITRWAKLKLGDEGAGYMVARSIFRHGTKGYFMFARGWLASQAWIRARFRKGLKEAVKKLAE